MKQNTTPKIRSAVDQVLFLRMLEMLFNKEGLNDITAAQYYLNEYYLVTKNEQALQKMEDLAKANDYLNKALEATKLAEVTFADTISARDLAETANAQKYAPDLCS